MPLGRRDSLGASISGSNHNIPAPNDTLPTIITKFKLKGLNLVDLVTLSGVFIIQTIHLHDILLVIRTYVCMYMYVLACMQVVTPLGKQGALVSDKGCTTKLGKGSQTPH